MADRVEQEIAVKQDKKKSVSDATGRILELFNVQVTLSAPESAGIQWVQLKGRKEDIETAKNYINSLCNPEIRDVKVSIPERYFDAISNYRNHVEKNSGAVVLFSSRKEACIQGSEMAVVIATSAIEERVNELKAGINAGLPQRKIDIEKTQATLVPYIDPSLEEFAIKLGYTKDDIHQVLKQQGKEVDQNTLLRELIKVSKPSLLQRARPEYMAPGTKPYFSHKDEVVARGAPSRAVPNSFPFEGASTQSALQPTRKEDVVARGAISRGSPRAFPYESPSLQGVLPQSDRQQYVNDRPEEDVLMYHQVIGNSATVDTSSDLRHVVIDGSNVAMSHGNQQYFSCMGIRICVEYFKKKGHKDITVFVPQWRKETPRHDSPMRNQEILAELEADRHLVFTPSRRVNGRRIVCYDDRFILKLANDTDGVVVSNDNFRDLFNENPEWQEVIEQRILMFSFVNDILMVPDDPLGRHGPNLDDFLRKGTPIHKRICPYLKRCTYGLRCRFYHPERDATRRENEAKKVVKPSSQRPYNPYVEQYSHNNYAIPQTLPRSQPIVHNGRYQEWPLDRERPLNSENYNPTDGPRAATFQELKAVFPGCEEIIIQVMRENPTGDMDYLAERIIIMTKIE